MYVKPEKWFESNIFATRIHLLLCHYWAQSIKCSFVNSGIYVDDSLYFLKYSAMILLGMSEVSPILLLLFNCFYYNKSHKIKYRLDSTLIMYAKLDLFWTVITALQQHRMLQN